MEVHDIEKMLNGKRQQDSNKAANFIMGKDLF